MSAAANDPHLSSGSAGAGNDWPAKATQRIEQVVELARDKSVRPLLAAVQVLVFGIVVAFMVLLVIALVAIAVLRILDVFVFHHRVWASYAALGAIFTLTGLFLLSRRRAPSERGATK